MALKTGRPSGRTKQHVSSSVDKIDSESRLTVLLPLSLKKELKKYALERDTDASKVVRNAIRTLIDKT